MNAVAVHLDANAAPLLKLSQAERIQAILADRFVHHERANALIKECRYYALRPRSLRPRGLLICGLSNAGKTAFSEALYRSLAGKPPTDRRPATRPYVLISTVSARDAGAIILRFLQALGCPSADRYTANQRRERAFELARLARVRALIVDELQDLVNITARQRVLTLLALKDIMNTLRIPIIALGTPKPGSR
jgi:type II secretory pathway predicted ATPase ExeA